MKKHWTSAAFQQARTICCGDRRARCQKAGLFTIRSSYCRSAAAQSQPLRAKGVHEAYSQSFGWTLTTFLYKSNMRSALPRKLVTCKMKLAQSARGKTLVRRHLCQRSPCRVTSAEQCALSHRRRATYIIRAVARAICAEQLAHRSAQTCAEQLAHSTCAEPLAQDTCAEHLQKTTS